MASALFKQKKRGGYWPDQARAGAFGLYAVVPRSYGVSALGFRAFQIKASAVAVGLACRGVACGFRASFIALRQ